MKKCILIVSVVLGIALGAAPVGHSITVDEVIALAQSGTQDGLILTKIDADQTVFQLTVSEILTLQKEGVSDNVITYMINTGKTLQDESERGSSMDEAYDEDEGETDYGEQDDADDDGSWNAAAGYSNQGFGITMGYYYPSWPGYYYASYYDPFFWPEWGGYYSYWSPYPYWRWYDRSYACYAFSYGYWDYYDTPYPYYGGHHGYGYVHGDYDGGRFKRSGRYAGSRGAVHRGSRRDGGYRAGSDAIMANNRLIGTPRKPNTRIVKRSGETAPSRGYTLRRPSVSVRKEKPGTAQTPRRLPDRGARVSPGPRVKVTPRQPATDVRKRHRTTKPRRIKRVVLGKQPVKVKPVRKVEKKKDDSKAQKKHESKQVTPRRQPRPSPQARPAPRRSSRSAPAHRRSSSSRRGGGGNRF